jgi:hypothetical protein
MATADELISEQLLRLSESEVPDASLLDPESAWEAVRHRALGERTNGHRGLLVAAAVFVVLVVAGAVLASYQRRELVETPSNQPPAPSVTSSGTAPVSDPPVGTTIENRLVRAELQALPFADVAPGSLVWTGRALIWWRGENGSGSAAHTEETWRYDRAANAWSQLPRDPLAGQISLDEPLGGALVGDEVVFWAPQGVIALDESSSRWRTVAAPPHDHDGPGVLAGDEIIFPLDGLAYTPATDTWRPVAPAPDGLWAQRAGSPQALWTGSKVVVAANRIGVYDPVTDTWRMADTYDPSQTSGSSGTRATVERVAWAVIEGTVTLLERYGTTMPVLDTDSGRWVDGLTPPATVACEGPGRLVSTAGGTMAQDGCGPTSWRPDQGQWSQVGIEGTAFGSTAGTFAYGSGPDRTGFTLWARPSPESGSGPATTESTPPPGGLQVRLELPSSTLAAGASMEGRVIVANNTGQPVTAVSCQSPFGVILANERAKQTGGQRMCAQTFVFAVGESSWPITVAANYGSCIASAGTIDPSIQQCLPGGGSPPLPAGRYTATAEGRGIDVTATAEIDVT